MKRITALVLALGMMLSLAACAEKDNTELESETVLLENVYSETKIENLKLSTYSDNIAIAGERLYVLENKYEDNFGSTTLSSCELDGSDRKVIWEQIQDYTSYMADEPDEEETEETEEESNRPVVNGVEYDEVSLSGFAPVEDGSIWLMMQYYRADYSDQFNPVSEQIYVLVKLDADGNELFSAPIVTDEDYFYAQYMLADGDGNLYISSGESLYVFGSDTGAMLFEIKAPQTDGYGYINSIVRSNTGDILYAVGGGNGSTIYRIDLATKGGIEIPGSSGSNYYNLLNGAGEYSVFYDAGNTIKGINLDTMEATDVVDYLNSDISRDKVQHIIGLDDGSFMIFKTGSDGWNIESAYRIEEDLEASKTPKTLLTYGCLGIYGDALDAIIRFNKQNSEYRIIIKDYSEYSTHDDYMAGYNQLSMDIISGKGPDIFNLQNLNTDNLISKGVLADLSGFLEKDADINMDDLFQNVLDIREGKVYHVIPSFSIQTMVGKQSLVGSGESWTMEEMQQALLKAPEGASAFHKESRASFMYSAFSLCLNEYVDWETGKTSFDDPSFVALLTFCASLPENIEYNDMSWEDWEAEQAYEETMYIEDKVLFEMQYVDVLRKPKDTANRFGEPINYIGYPTNTGAGSIINPNGDFAIAASGKNQEACWQFIRMLLMEDYVQSTSMFRGYSFPINRNALQTMLKIEMIPLPDRDYSNGVEIVETMANGASMYTIDSYDQLSDEEKIQYANYHLSQAEADQVIAIIESGMAFSNYNESIMEIVEEEAEEFFEGRKTAEETAKMIQSRVQLYVSESM